MGNRDRQSGFHGPVEEAKWPDRIRAHAVTAGIRPRLHGYDVESDLAHHYDHSELTLLALTGELPSELAARAFEVALCFLAPAPVSEPPAHAAVLSRMSGATPAGVLSTGLVALAEQAQFLVAEHRELLSATDDASVAAPEPLSPRSDEERQAVARLKSALQSRGVRIPVLDQNITLIGAILSTLSYCGLQTQEQQIAVIIQARIACVCREAFSVAPGSFRDYPIDLPPYEYEER